MNLICGMAPTELHIRPYRFRWAGGKRWLAPTLATHLPRSVLNSGLSEPFAGGAALTFAAPLSPGTLADVNSELMNAYKVIRDEPLSLLDRLSNLPIDPDTFHEVRGWTSTDRVDRATRFVYLNRTSWGGLWRENRQGHHNVPYHVRTSTRLPQSPEILALSRYLAAKDLLVRSFPMNVFESTTDGLMYVDPPYAIPRPAPGDVRPFVRYSSTQFSWDSQRDLAHILADMMNAGQRIAISNVWHPEIVSIYREHGFKIYRVLRRKNLACTMGERASHSELIALSNNLRWNRTPDHFERVFHGDR